MVSVSNFLSYVSNLAHNEDGDGLADTVVWPPEGNDFTALRAELHNVRREVLEGASKRLLTLYIIDS